MNSIDQSISNWTQLRRPCSFKFYGTMAQCLGHKLMVHQIQVKLDPGKVQTRSVLSPDQRWTIYRRGHTKHKWFQTKTGEKLVTVGSDVGSEFQNRGATLTEKQPRIVLECRRTSWLSFLTWATFDDSFFSNSWQPSPNQTKIWKLAKEWITTFHYC